MAAVSGGLPRLSEIQAWDTQHLTTAAQSWDDTATRWQNGFADVVQQSYTPGGSAWEGVAATAAQERALADRTKVNNVAERLRTLAADARTGATEISAARRQVLSAVNAARAKAFEVADDLSVSYVDDGTSTAAKRARAETLAREIWGRAAELATTDRKVAERITASSGDIQSLSFGPGLGGPKEAPPNEALGVHDAEDVHDVVDPLPPGNRPHVRELRRRSRSGPYTST